MAAESTKKRIRLSVFQKIVLGFLALIALGTLLLMLPVSTRERQATPVMEALFTSTSAACVTGLVVHDTALYWSDFGQAVILVLIQIGGLGVVTVAAMFAVLAGRKISITQRTTMQETVAAPNVGGIVRFTLFIVLMTLIFELTGALVLLAAFVPAFGARGIWMAVFHSISAFCNAGFDIMGAGSGEYSSLTAFRANPLVNITVMLLIIIGGIGFLTWDDVRRNRFRVRKYRLQTKIILVFSAILIVVPAVLFFIFEYRSLPLGERVLTSLFQAVTPRTAGFNTAALDEMSGAGRLIMIVLMLVGGSPGSTAGGMKTTTLAVLLANTVAVFRRRDEPAFFGRRIDASVNKSAGAILILYLTLFTCGAGVISCVEGLPIDVCLFETASAVGTVGLSLGLTPGLGVASQAVLIVLMFLGRVGGLTVIYAAFSDRNMSNSRFPTERVTVG